MKHRINIVGRRESVCRGFVTTTNNTKPDREPIRGHQIVESDKVLLCDRGRMWGKTLTGLCDA